MEKQLIEILTRLVDLKDYKDKYGKDEHYLQEQPVLWEKARTLLKACEGKADSTSEKDLRVCEVIASAWISVEERLPEIGQKVITFRPLAELSGDEKITIQNYVGGKNTSPQGIIHGFDRWCHPSHWMPLIEEPK